ncbi:MAG: ComEC/Rec2 family competence protein [Anaerolineaceae bacterium]|nr:ComEC/Rec2 family competence protein [Anaerolineaceae bacterium]
MRRIPLFWISSAFLISIPLADVLSVPIGYWRISFWISLGLSAIEWLARKRWRSLRIICLPVFLVLAVLMGGGLRYTALQQKPFTPNDVAFYNEQQELKITGVVCADPQQYERHTRLIVCVDRLLAPIDRNLEGKILVIQRTGEWKYGDRVNIRGQVLTPDENEAFSYKDYLAQRGIHSMMVYPYVQWLERGQAGWVKTGLFALRQTAYQRIQTFFLQPEAGLLSGILLGIETDIPSDLKRAFQDTGTAHIVAISGFNMTILAGIFLKGFRKWLSIWWAALLAIVVISLYTILVGANPAVIRAALMSCLAMSAGLIGRGQSGIYTLSLTAAVMCLFNPLLVWDPGFQLSATATLGLVLYSDRMMNWFRNLAGRYLPESIVERVTGPVSDYFLFTLAAQVMTLPVVLYHFEQLSLTTLLANPLILPVQPLVMILGGIAVLVGLLISPLGQLLSYLVWAPLFYTNQVVTWLAGFSGGVLELGEVSIVTVVALYLLIFFFTHKKEQQNLQKLKTPAILTSTLVASIFLVWNAVLLKPDGMLHLWILDEPNEGVVLVQTPGGKRILVNSGDSANHLSSELNQHIPTLDRSLDLAIVTRPKTDSYQSFQVLLERYKMGKFLWGYSIPDTVTAQEVIKELKYKKVDIGILQPGELVDCGDGVRFEKLAVEDNGFSLLLTYGEFRFIWQEEAMISMEGNQLIDGAVVLASPGLKDSLEGFVWQPQLYLHHEFVDGDEYGKISTEQTGRIEIVTDGKQMWMMGKKR